MMMSICNAAFAGAKVIIRWKFSVRLPILTSLRRENVTRTRFIVTRKFRVNFGLKKRWLKWDLKYAQHQQMSLE